MERYTYLLLDLFTLLGPLALSFDKKVAFYKWWEPLFLRGILPTAAFFIFWDVMFTHWAIWNFNPDYLCGIFWLGLPIEEWLFFIVVPYACAFIYACIRAYGKWRGQDKGVRITAVLGVLLLAIGLIYWDRPYTIYAFGGSGLGCILAVLFRRRAPRFRFDTFLVSYLVILVPFLLVNGVLTAMPVVRYDDTANLAIRMYTIPVEDTFYGLLMIGMTVWGCYTAERKFDTSVED